jgi:hypothetical protein
MFSFKISEKLTLFQNEFLSRMLITCQSLIQELKSWEELDIASRGSHKDEF